MVANASGPSGWAFLAAEHKDFPVKKCAEYAKAAKYPFIAAVADSFGVDKRCLRNFMANTKGKEAHWMYYLGNGAGRRKQLRPYEFLYRLKPDEYNEKLCSGDKATKQAVVKQAREFKNRCEKVAHNKASCLIALELESQFTECAAKRMVEYVKLAGVDPTKIVHNPVNIGPYQGRGNAHVLERHWVLNRGAEAPYHLGIDGACADHCGPCGITGSRVTSDQILQWRANHQNRKDIFFSLWCPEHQGLLRDSGTAPEPRKRTIRVSESSFELGNRLVDASLEPLPPAQAHDTKGCAFVKEFGKGNLAKESDHGGFVAVMVNKLNNARLVTPKGTKYSLKYTGLANPFNGKARHHYRHPKAFAKMQDNMVLKGKEGGKNACYKLYTAGERVG
jgi:hypothetical protein